MNRPIDIGISLTNRKTGHIQPTSVMVQLDDLAELKVDKQVKVIKKAVTTAVERILTKENLHLLTQDGSNDQEVIQ